MRTLFFIALIIPGVTFASPTCKEGNALPVDMKNISTALGIDWMENAVFCDFGTFQVLTPSSGKSDSIVILKNNKLFVMHQKGYGLNFFQEYVKDKPVPSVTVQDWNKDGIYERLDYSLIDENGEVVGDVQDKTMEGSVSVIKFKK